jgi:hypothetical protein
MVRYLLFILFFDRQLCSQIMYVVGTLGVNYWAFLALFLELLLTIYGNVKLKCKK